MNFSFSEIVGNYSHPFFCKSKLWSQISSHIANAVTLRLEKTSMAKKREQLMTNSDIFLNCFRGTSIFHSEKYLYRGKPQFLISPVIKLNTRLSWNRHKPAHKVPEYQCRYSRCGCRESPVIVHNMYSTMYICTAQVMLDARNVFESTRRFFYRQPRMTHTR